MLKAKKLIFTSSVGDDIEVAVSGLWEPPERSVGYRGNFIIDKITLPNSEIDIQSLIESDCLERLVDEGMCAGER